MPDFSYLSRPSTIQLPDPVEQTQRRFLLSQLADADVLRKLKMEQANRENLAADEFPRLYQIAAQGNFSPEVMAKVMGQARYAAPQIEAAREKWVKSESDLATAKSTQRKNESEALTKAFDAIGGTAYNEMQNPSPMSINKVRWVADQFKVNLPQYAGDPNDQNALKQYLGVLFSGSMSAKEQIANETTKRGQDLTRQSSMEGHAVTIRGQDISSRDAAASRGVTMRGQDMTDARAREATDQGKWANDLERGIQVNSATGQSRPIVADGQPIGAKKDAKQAQASQRALAVIDEADKYINEATGSFAGAGIDLAARAVGQSTKGANAVAKLQALEGALMLNQPRMEGPQSNLDVQLYRQMAGRIGDPTVPREQKREALSVIRSLNEKYAEINGAATAPKPVSNTPRIGEVRKGYMYKGGDPASQSSWEKVSQ